MLFLQCALLDDIEAELEFPGRIVFSSLKQSSDDLDFGETVLGVGENGNGLVKSNAWKPFEKFTDRCASFKVLKQSSYWHARSSKNPGAADFACASFYLLTVAPIQHVQHDMLQFRQQQ